MSDHLRACDAALERLKALHPRRIDLSLGRMARLCAALGDPQDRLPPTIHVAGTNGKGSTVAFMRAMAEAAGLRVHVFTSPHLVRFSERVRLAGGLISDAALAGVLERVEAANGGEPITFFEITTAAAFLAFSETPADLCLVEVGLGGRYDATNVLRQPSVCALAPIDLDHREFLGEDLAAIAGEKAGIVKRGARVVCARQADAALAAVAREAARTGASLQVMGEAFDAWIEDGRLLFRDEDRLMDLPTPALAGAHQASNAGLAIAALLACPEAPVDEAAAAEGLRRVSWPARMQRLTAGPYGRAAAARGADLWLDGGHNPHAAAAAAAALGELARDGRPAVLVAGLLANKDADGFFRAFSALGPKVVAAPFAAEAAASPEAVVAAAARAGLGAVAAPSLKAAIERALEGGDGPPPHVLVCGSLYLAGEVLEASPETWPR